MFERKDDGWCFAILYFWIETYPDAWVINIGPLGIWNFKPMEKEDADDLRQIFSFELTWDDNWRK